jgi:transposase-like protein
LNVVTCAPAGYRFPREVIAVAVPWYLRYALSSRDGQELLPGETSSSIT